MKEAMRTEGREEEKILNGIDWGGGVVGSLPGRVSTLAAGFVDAGAADVPHPFDDIVVTVVQLGLKHLQVANLQARWRKRDLRRQRKDGLDEWRHAGNCGSKNTKH